MRERAINIMMADIRNDLETGGWKVEAARVELTADEDGALIPALRLQVSQDGRPSVPVEYTQKFAQLGAAIDQYEAAKYN